MSIGKPSRHLTMHFLFGNNFLRVNLIYTFINHVDSILRFHLSEYRVFKIGKVYLGDRLSSLLVPAQCGHILPACLGAAVEVLNITRDELLGLGTSPEVLHDSLVDHLVHTF